MSDMHSYGRGISRRRLLSLVTALPAGRLLRGQRSDQTFSTDVKVVQVFATVRTSKGPIVRDLGKDDFKLEEDRRAQTIRYFSRESDLPLTLGLLIDISGSMLRVLDEERSASSIFFDQVLREDRDKAFVIHFDNEIDLLQDLTSSRKELQAALSEMKGVASQRWNRGNTPGGQGGGGGTALYEAVRLAADDFMKKQTGRKAIIVLSDGIDNTSRASLADAIASAQKADTLVYTILIADEQQRALQSPMGSFGGGGRRGGMGPVTAPLPPLQDHPDGKKIMERLAKETGGGFFEVSKKQPIEKMYEQIQEELRSQYSLGYTPDSTDAGPGFRKIHVTVLQKGTVVQTRGGYFADK
jgi:VWFA-related protein